MTIARIDLPSIYKERSYQPTTRAFQMWPSSISLTDEAREVFAQQACIGHLKERPALATNQRADPALIGRLEQGAHVGVTGIACKPRQLIPRGTWSVERRSSLQMEKVIPPCHPAAALSERTA